MGALRSRARLAIAVAAGAAALAVSAILVADDPGAPLPFRLQGLDCLRYDDLAACRSGRAGTRYFVRNGNAWIPPSGCSPARPDRVRCLRPYPLELGFGGDAPELDRVE